MFRPLTHLLARRVSPGPAPSAPVLPPSEPARFRFDRIEVRDRAVPQLRRAAGITRFDLIELLAGGHFRSLRERAVGSTGAWANTAEARAALATVSRDLHLLVFDPEREAFVVAYAKADPQARRLTVTGVVAARQYEHAHWHLLPMALYRDLCAQSIADADRRERLLASALGERDLHQLPILFALETSKRAVWVELTRRDGGEKRIGLLPFALKQQRAADLPGLAPFWDWVQTQRAGKPPIDPASIAAVRLLGHRDPYDTRIVLV